MRERLEPLALAESLPQLTDDDDSSGSRTLQEQIEADADLDRFLELDREFHLLTYSGCHIEQLNAIVDRLWNSTQHYRRAFVALGGPGPDVGRQRRAPAAARRRRRAATPSTPSATSPATSAAPGSSWAATRRCSHDHPDLPLGRPLAAPGHMGVDYEDRVDFARLREYRLDRARPALTPASAAPSCSSTSTTSATPRRPGSAAPSATR